jgi:CSLREA domain-containing protein
MNRHSTLHILLLAIAALLLASACTPSPVCEPVYLVTKTDDTNDGVCSASDCSLREAVDNANACPGAQTIQLPAGNYPLTLAGADEDANATGDLDITDDLSIVGTGAPSISGEDQDRIFEVFSPAVVDLELLILINGNAQLGGAVRNHGDLTILNASIHDNVAAVPLGGIGSSSGGGIFNEAGTLSLEGTQIFANEADEGGGIHNFATAELNAQDVLLQGNTASDMGGGIWVNFASNATLNDVELRDNEAVNHGGGIYSDGHLEANWITLVENVAGLNGGGLWNGPDGEAFLYDAWFTNNNASAGGGVFNQGLTHLYRSSVNNNSALGGLGGGAYNDLAGALFLQNTTLSANMIVAPPGAPGGSGVFNIGDLRLEFITAAYNNVDGLRNDAGGTMTIRSSVLAYHSGGNCSGTTPMSPSLGFNISDDASCGFVEGSDLNSTDPLLAFLASNGGNGLSHMPNPGSPAIDSGDPDKCISEDQRSVSRPQGSACDRGSIEVESPSIGPPPTPTPVPPTLGTVTGALCYPSEGIPPMDLYFLEIGSQVVTSFPHLDGTASYSHDLSPGTYVAYAYPQGYNIGGSYSQAVPCGLTVNCTDHSLIQFPIVAGQVTSGVDICDWYGQPGDVPAPDGSMPATPTPTPVLQPSAKFIMNAFCRKGPGTEYGTSAGYEMGQVAGLIGRSEPGRPLWWLTELRCWVSDSTVETSGPVEDLPPYPAPPTPVPVTPPEAPARFRISDRVCDPKLYTVTLSWIDQAGNEDGYRLYRDGGLIATLGADANGYVDSPPRGGAHSYALEAFNAGGASPQVTAQDQGCQ